MRGLVPRIHVVQRAMRPDVDGRDEHGHDDQNESFYLACTTQLGEADSRGADARAPIRITTRVTLERKDFLTAEALLAPLSEDGSSVSMLFVCVGFWSDA